MLNQIFVVSYIIGVILAYECRSFDPTALVICLVGIPLCLLLPNRWKQGCCGVLLGLTTVFLAASYHQTKALAPELWQKPLIVHVQVNGVRSLGHHLYQYEVKSSTLKQSLKLSDYASTQRLKVGGCYELTGKFKPKHALGNPTTFSLGKSQWANREFVRGYVVQKKPLVPVACEDAWYNMRSMRTSVQQIIDGAGLSDIATSMISALVLGRKLGLTQADWDVLHRTGTSHLLAISGLHIGLVYLLSYYLAQIILRPLALVLLRTNILILSAGVGLLISGFYVLISGAGVSSQRAWGMLCVMVVMVFYRQRLANLSVLLFVIAAILLIDPLAGMGMGLWLSAFAVFSLIWLQANKWSVHWKLPFMMFPVTSLWLNSAWLAPVSNLFAIPLVSFLIVPGALLGTVAALMNIPGAHYLLTMMGWVIDYCWAGLTWVSGYSALHHWSLLTVIDKIIFTVLFACLLLPWRFVGVVPFFIFFMALSFPRPMIVEDGVVRLHIIDAGQGTAVWIQVADKHLLFDAGSRVVLDYLKHYRVPSLDVVVISHRDKDHRAGLEDVLQNMPVKAFYVGEKLTEHSPVEQRACRAGEAWEWNNVRFEFLSPLSEGDKGNNASCVLRISVGDQHVLLTGDIEKKIERRLMKAYEPSLLKATILVAPHHGSKTSSSVSFIQAVSPEMVIYPTGFLNAYRHPHPDIIARYTSLGSKQYNTAQDGALSVKLSKDGIQSIQCYSQAHQRWWSQSEEAKCSGYLAQVGP